MTDGSTTARDGSPVRFGAPTTRERGGGILMRADGRYLFVTGAARSGTHLLGSLIRDATDGVYLGEMNDFWRSLVPTMRHDMIPRTAASQGMADRFRRTFDQDPSAGSEAPFLIDKTAANSLRLPFLHALFPSARFVHIIRDGHDVAISASRKYGGDMRKITKVEDGSRPSVRERASGAGSLLRRKAGAGLSPMRILREPRRYIAAAQRALGRSAAYPWGPMVPGLIAMARSHTVLEVATYQWRCCVESALAFHEAYPDASYVEVRYEQLVTDPRAALEPVLASLEIDPGTLDLEGRIVAGGPEYADLLTDQELASVRAIAGWTLRGLGYS